jgi:rhodanese-related sulfurtransferase
MATEIALAELQRLIGAGAQLVEVLPEDEYTDMHLPGATNLPLKQLDAQSTALLDRSRPIVVYCWDGL